VTSPYRTAPQFLPCPRCGEMLDRVFDGVWSCPRCWGAWISQATLDVAFGNPRWPPGHSTLSHDELACPECSAAGTSSKLIARSSNEVLVDACPRHGVWLDRGELGRLMNLSSGANELYELQGKVASSSPNPEALQQRRQAWRAELEARRREAEEFRAGLRSKRRDGDEGG
jgi:Zn-finger nucleic acid-binding protein